MVPSLCPREMNGSLVQIRSLYTICRPPKQIRSPYPIIKLQNRPPKPEMSTPFPSEQTKKLNQKTKSVHATRFERARVAPLRPERSALTTRPHMLMKSFPSYHAVEAYFTVREISSDVPKFSLALNSAKKCSNFSQRHCRR